jgi:hypothetical protein
MIILSTSMPLAAYLYQSKIVGSYLSVDFDAVAPNPVLLFFRILVLECLFADRAV